MFITRYLPRNPELCICKFKNGSLVPIALDTDSKLEIAGFIYLCTINPAIELFWFTTFDEYILDYDSSPEDILNTIRNETEIL